MSDPITWFCPSCQDYVTVPAGGQLESPLRCPNCGCSLAGQAVVEEAATGAPPATESSPSGVPDLLFASLPLAAGFELPPALGGSTEATSGCPDRPLLGQSLMDRGAEAGRPQPKAPGADGTTDCPQPPSPLPGPVAPSTEAASRGESLARVAPAPAGAGRAGKRRFGWLVLLGARAAAVVVVIAALLAATGMAARFAVEAWRNVLQAHAEVERVQLQAATAGDKLQEAESLAEEARRQAEQTVERVKVQATTVGDESRATAARAQEARHRAEQAQAEAEQAGLRMTAVNTALEKARREVEQLEDLSRTLQKKLRNEEEAAEVLSRRLEDLRRQFRIQEQGLRGSPAAALSGVGYRTAWLHWRQYDILAARAALDSAPPEARGWEWHLLRHLCESTCREVKGHADTVLAVALSADGRWLASGSMDQTVKTWSFPSGKAGPSFADHASPVSSVALSADGSWLVSGSFDSTLQIRNLRSGEARSLAGHSGPVRGVAISHSGRTVVSGGGPVDQPGEVKVWNGESGGEVRSLYGQSGPVSCVALSADGEWIVSGGLDGTLRVWNAQTGKRRSLSEPNGPIRCVAISADGRWVASGGGQPDRPGELTVWDARRGDEVLTLQAHAGPVWSVAISPDGEQVFSGGGAADGAGEVKGWRVPGGQELFRLRGQRGPVRSLAVSLDGRWIATSSGDQGVRVWQVGEKVSPSAKRASVPGEDRAPNQVAVARTKGRS